MQTHERETYMLHAGLPVHKRRIKRATAIVLEALSACERPYVSFSAGKDSAALLHIAMSVRPDIEARILLWDGESNHLGNFVETIDAWQARGARICIHYARRSSLRETAPDRWEILQTGHDAVLVGYRADESRGRRISLRRWGPIHRLSSGLLRVAPLHDWTTADVAALIEAHGLPCLSTYSAHGYDERTSARVPRRGSVRDRAMAELRERDPAAWARLCARFPEVRMDNG